MSWSSWDFRGRGWRIVSTGNLSRCFRSTSMEDIYRHRIQSGSSSTYWWSHENVSASSWILWLCSMVRPWRYVREQRAAVLSLSVCRAYLKSTGSLLIAVHLGIVLHPPFPACIFLFPPSHTYLRCSGISHVYFSVQGLGQVLIGWITTIL